MSPLRRTILGAAGAVLATGGVLAQRRTMPELSGAVAWLNSPPLQPQDLRGRVVLVQFWTFTCINWLRTLPYVNAWWDRYRRHGLVVVGVHTPEFSFEQDIGQVRDAAARLQVGYPVAVDSRQAVWNAFGNAAWPALYLVDASGRVRFHHDGEGAYDEAELAIRQLLAETGAKDLPGGLAQVQGRGAQAPADWASLRSPETYLGARKAERFRSPGGIAGARDREYEMPRSLPANTWAAAGHWNFGPEAARSLQPQARIAYRFHARDVNLVMGARLHGKPVPFRVRIDGQPPGPAHGSDADAGGHGTLAEARLYQLVRQTGAVRERLFEIEFLEPGAELYAFTFG
ncbi:MAG TPA: redoxin domain-containing protein [Ramlibacter sp.]|nr:redoxin domain-containing protein [Ramlibacter sp.]